MRIWKQCLCKVLGEQIKSIMVFLMLANSTKKAVMLRLQTELEYT